MTFSAWCLLHRKTARFSSNSRNGRTVVFCVAFRGDFQGKYGHGAAQKSPLVLRAGQNMPCEIVVFRYRFGVHFCRFPLLSFLPLSHTFFRLSLRPLRAALIAAPKALKSYCGTGLFAIFIHPITFYSSPFFLDMSIPFYQLAKIIHN